MFKAILFDLDNTLIDFLTFKKETAKAAAKAIIKQGMHQNRILSILLRKLILNY